MSHEFESGFFNRVAAWHGLGTVVQDAPTTGDALALAGCDWTVSSRSVYAQSTSPGEVLGAEDYRAIVRDSDESVLGVVSPSYRPHQNRDAFAFADAILGHGVRAESAGSLESGRAVWLLARLDTAPIRPVPGDDIHPYLLLTTRHDGRGATTARLTSVRVVCHNTLTAAIGARKADYSIRHTSDLQARVNQAADLLGAATRATAAISAQLADMARAPMTVAQWSTFLDDMIGADDTGKGRRASIRDDLTDLFETDPRREGLPAIAGTRYAALNAVTAYTSHARATRAVGGRSAEEARLGSLWYGDSAAMQSRAMELLAV